MLDDTESLDDLTFSILWESATPTPLWEVFWAAQPDGDVADVERVLDWLFAQELFVFQRRPMNSSREVGALMSADEVQQAIRDPRYRDPTTLTGDAVWMVPTARYERWRRDQESRPR